MPRRVPDISRAAALVGFQPSTALDEILRQVIAHESGSTCATAAPIGARHLETA